MNQREDDKANSAPTLKTRVAKGTFWITFEMLGVQCTAFAVFIALAHFVGPRDFGLISISYLTMQSLQMLLLFNTTTVVARKPDPVDLEYTTTFWVAFLLSLSVFLLLFLSAGFAETLFAAPGLAPVLRAMSIMTLFMGLARTHETWLVRNFRFKALAMRALLGAVVGGVVGVVMAMHGAGVMALVGQQVTASLTSLMLLWITCPWRPTFKFSKSFAVEILLFMRSITPNSVVYTVNQNCDTFMVAYFFGPISAGVFNVGKRIRLMLQLVTGAPINAIALPALAEIQNDAERLKRAVIKSVALISIVGAPAVLGTAAVAYDAVLVLFGQKWIAAAPVVQWLAFAAFAMITLAYNDNILILKHRTRWLLTISMTYSGLAIAIFLLCHAMGLEYIASPFVLPYLIVFPLSCTLVSKAVGLKFSDWIAAMLPGVGAAIIMSVCVTFAGYYLPITNPLVRLIILSLVGGLSYVAVLWLVWRSAAEIVLDLTKHMLRK